MAFWLGNFDTILAQHTNMVLSIFHSPHAVRRLDFNQICIASKRCEKTTRCESTIKLPNCNLLESLFLVAIVRDRT